MQHIRMQFRYITIHGRKQIPRSVFLRVLPTCEFFTMFRRILPTFHVTLDEGQGFLK